MLATGAMSMHAPNRSASFVVPNDSINSPPPTKLKWATSLHSPDGRIAHLIVVAGGMMGALCQPARTLAPSHFSTFRLKISPMKILSITSLFSFVTLIAGCYSYQSNVPKIDKTAGMTPVHLTDRNFGREVFESELPVLVEMWVPWCVPCVEMKPTLRQLAEVLADQVKVAELNIEDNVFTKEKYGVDRYPMLLIFVNGKEVQRVAGRKEISELKSFVHHSLAINNSADFRDAVPQ